MNGFRVKSKGTVETAPFYHWLYDACQIIVNLSFCFRKINKIR